MTSVGSPPTAASTSPEPDVCTGVPGKARPISSAVRRAPVTADRSRRDPQCWHSKDPGASPRPHHRHDGGAPEPVTDTGPWHRLHRTGVRHSAQLSDGR